MKRKILAVFTASLYILSALTGCGNNTQDEETGTYPVPSDFTPAYYLTEEELPENQFYIVHETVDEEGNAITQYFPLYYAEQSYTGVNNSPSGADASRFVWVNYNIDEGLIPTMYPEDIMIYKSSTDIPVTYYLEKFYDEGYTFGVAGLYQDLSGNYRYSEGQGSLAMTTSDASGFAGLEAESIYFVSAGDMRISPECISPSGTVMGLDLMKVYDCDIRTGTEKISAALTANIHYFSSAENYLFGSFSFVSEHIAQINIPDYVTTGYYSLNDAGFYRYLKDEPDYTALTDTDYNKTIYAYEEGRLTGTKDGLVFDDNDFLVKPEIPETEDSPEKQKELSMQDVMNDINEQYQSITCTLTAVSEPVYYDTGCYYDIQAEEFSARLYMENTQETEIPETGNTYLITCMQSSRPDYEGTEVFTINKQ